MKLVLVRLSCMENFNIAVLHPDSEPVPSGTPSETEYLTAEVVLLELSSLSEVPRADRVVQTSGPKLGAVSRDINAAGPVCVSLELSDQSLVMKIPHSNVPVAERKLGNVTDLLTISRIYLQQLKQTLESGLMARA